MNQGLWQYDYSVDLANLLFQFLNYFGNNIDFSVTTFFPWDPFCRNNSPTNSFDHHPIYMRMPWASDPLLIIDPLNNQNNVGKSSFKITEIKAWFEEAYNVINSVLSNTSEKHMYELKHKFLVVVNDECRN